MAILEGKPAFDTFVENESIEDVRRVFKTLPKNQEFIVEDVARLLSIKLNISVDTIAEILRTPRPHLFEDVPPGIARIDEIGSLPIVWTQGHVSDGGDLTGEPEMQSLSFQPLKVVRSGLHQYLHPFVSRLQSLGIPSLVGGSNKVTGDILVPVLEAGLQGGIERVVGVDDLETNLDGLGNICQENNIEYYPVPIKRAGDSHEGSIQTFADLPLYPNALYLLDLDRTMIDTDLMKEDLYQRLAQCVSVPVLI